MTALAADGAAPPPQLLRLLGPAFVAAIAYVDPGNVAANITAGARHGYLLVWVLVVANAVAVLVQYLSAKLGVVTGLTLPQVLGRRLGRRARLAFWVQAEVVAAATDLAEVIGGAVALNLLFAIPLAVGGLAVGVASLLLLTVQQRGRAGRFEVVIIALLAVIAVAFSAGLVVAPVDAGQALRGLVPRLAGPDTVLLAASMLGATVMPHAIYLHSALARDHHGAVHPARRRAVLAGTRLDVGAALILAGAVNVAMLLLAAASLRGVAGTDSLAGAHAAVSASLGAAVGVVFAVGLLASGLASTSVGAYAGAAIMEGLLRVRVPLLVRRVVTLIPAMVFLTVGVDPTRALVLSQVVLSFGIPFALVPLVRFTGDRTLMGEHANAPGTTVVAAVAVAGVVVLNGALLVLTIHP